MRKFPKPWAGGFLQGGDVIVTVGCGDACPIFPGGRHEDSELADPWGKPVDDASAR